MHTTLNTRLTRAALKAARPARRHLMSALRHHAARTRALAEHVLEAQPVDGMRAWFHSFFSALRVRSGARHLSLHALLYRAGSAPRKLGAPASARAASRRAVPDSAENAAVRSLPASRRPRRMATGSSAGWFAFAAR